MEIKLNTQTYYLLDDFIDKKWKLETVQDLEDNCRILPKQR